METYRMAEQSFSGSPIPIAINKKKAITNTAPFRTIPVITNHNFFDVIAKIIPSMECPVNTPMIHIKLALDPLMIKKKITLIITVNMDKNPVMLFLLKFTIKHSFNKLQHNKLVVNLLFRYFGAFNCCS